MAVRFDDAADRCSYSGANPPAPSTGLTITAWVYLSADQNDEQTWCRLWTGSTTVTTWATSSDGTGGPNYFTASGTVTNATGFIVGEWRKCAITCSGTTAHCYVATPGGVTEHDSGTVGTGTPTGITLGGRGPTDATEWFNGRLAYVRIWSAQLTQTEIEAEWLSTTPVRSTNIWANWPLATASNLTDTVASRTLTVLTGPVTTEADPPLSATYDKGGGATGARISAGAKAVGSAIPDSVFDLANWKITLPTGPPTDATEVAQPTLATFFDANFYLDSSSQMVMVAPTSGSTTTGSTATRLEAREMQSGAEAAWNMATSANRFLTVTAVFDPTGITGGTGARQEMIVGQIHGSSGTPPMYLAVEFTSGTPGTPLGSPRLRVYKDGPGISNPLTGLSSSTQITYRVEVAGGRAKLWAAIGTVANLPVNPQFDWASTDFTEDTTACYFKFGSYNKTTVASGSTGSAIATISSLTLLQTSGTVRLKDGGGIGAPIADGAKSVASATVYTKDGGGTGVPIADGGESVTSATVYTKDGGATGAPIADGARLLTFSKDGGATGAPIADGAQSIAGATTYDKDGGATALVLGDGAQALSSATTYDKDGGATFLATGDGAQALSSATTVDKDGGATTSVVGDGAEAVSHAATVDKDGGATAAVLGDGAQALSSATTVDKDGGAIALATGDGSSSVVGPTTYDKGGGANALVLGDGLAEVQSVGEYNTEGGATALMLGAGTASVSSASFWDGDGGAIAGPIADGEWDLESATNWIKDGEAPAQVLGDGSVSVASAATHDKTGGAIASALGDGSGSIAGAPSTHDKTGGAPAMAIAAGTKSVIRGGTDSGGAFVTLLHDIRVRVGDTWASPTWAILLPGGYGIDLDDGWTMKASVRRHRADGGAEVYAWIEPDGIGLGQATVTLADGTPVTTSTIVLRHTGADSEEWPIFVGRWDVEISKGTDDYTVAAGSFRTVREVTS